MGKDEYLNKVGEYRDRMDNVNSYSGQKQYDAASSLFFDMAVDGIVAIAGGIKGIFDKHQDKKLEARRLENEKRLEAKRLENEKKLEAQRLENEKRRPVNNTVWVCENKKTTIAEHIYFVFGEDTVELYRMYRSERKADQRKIISKGYIPNIPKLINVGIPYVKNSEKVVLSSGKGELICTVWGDTLTDWNNNKLVKINYNKIDFYAYLEKLLLEQKKKNEKKRKGLILKLIVIAIIVLLLWFFFKDNINIYFDYVKDYINITFNNIKDYIDFNFIERFFGGKR